MSRYKLKISGKNPKYLIDEFIKYNVNLYYVKLGLKELIIIIDSKDLDIVYKYKRRYKIVVLNTYGQEKVRRLCRKYFVFIIGLFIGFLLLTLLSNTVFSIDVITSDEYIKNMIITDLEEFGIRKHGFCVSFNKKKQIENKILDKESDKLEWISIKRIGTKYEISLVPKIRQERSLDTNLRNIVAKKDAMILRVEAIKGEVRVKKFDYVKKGDVLISGVITKDGAPVSKVSANGRVYGEVWYKVKVVLPEVYKEENLTGDTKKVLKISFLDHCLEFFSLNKYETYKGKDLVTLFKNKAIPISVKFVEEKKTKIKVIKYDTSSSASAAVEIAEDKINGGLSDDEEIISSKVLRKIVKPSRIEVEVFFKVSKNITDYFDITNLNIESEETKDE